MRVTSRRHIVHNASLTGRPATAAPAHAPKTGAKNRGKIGAKERGKEPLGRGLGDAVERVAKPSARVIDRVSAWLGARWATKLAGCSACSRRRAFLNMVVRDAQNWREWVSLWTRLRAAWRRYYGRPRVH